MSVCVAASPGLLAYKTWHPSQQQVVEPDTLYLMDPNVEATLTTLAEGRMIGAGEANGTAPKTNYLPPWLGGTHVDVVTGRYLQGLKCVSDVNYGYLCKPSSGLINAAQGTIEFQVNADQAWSALSNQTAFQVNQDPRQYMQVIINAGNIKVVYRHQQNSAGEIDQTVQVAHSASAGQWVSVAFTWLSSVVTLYLDETEVGSVSGCTPPAFWNDSWLCGQGIAVSVGATDLAVSDLRISALARVPGQVP
jgi:hypothetical protein